MFNYIYALVLVTQIGLSNDVDPSTMKLGKAAIPGYLTVVPQELVITFTGPGIYRQEIEVNNYGESGQSFELYYRPDNIRLAGAIGSDNDGKGRSILKIEMTITGEDWKNMVQERNEARKNTDMETALKSEGVKRRNPNLPDAVSKLGWRIRNLNGNETGVLDIPVFISYQFERSKEDVKEQQIKNADM